MNDTCQIDFYHLTKSDLGANIAMLAAKITGSGHKALIVCTKIMVDTISSALWETQAETFLAHGIGAGADETGNPHVGLWLTQDPDSNPIAADYLLLTNGLDVSDIRAYKRLFLLFDGGSEAELSAARTKWKNWSKDADVACRYFVQDEAGKWLQKA